MSIRESVLSYNGSQASLEEILRCIAIFVKKSKKMLITTSHVHYSTIMLFTDDKYREAHHLGETNLSNCIGKQEYPPNFKENKNKIRSILGRYGNFRIDDGVIYYLDGIYENIPDYVEQDLHFITKYNATDIIIKCGRTAGYSGKDIIRAKHFEIAHEILSPFEKLEIVWDIEKNKDVIENFLRRRSSVRYRISDDLFQRLTE